jgi:hypothetical protein
MRSDQKLLAKCGTGFRRGPVVEIGERNAGDAHVTGRGRLHGFADDLRGVGNRDEVEIFAEGTDEDGFPEAVNGGFGLAVLVTPLQKRLSGVGLDGEGEGGNGARNRELVCY